MVHCELGTHMRIYRGKKFYIAYYYSSERLTANVARNPGVLVPIPLDWNYR